ncbi:HAMP domain-containing sensor histidine kinase [Nisaea sp.]|uniref:sensor histidine kinase n=1 Tax=Nisaea sp. TaxID=2024842 RepID=UPI0032EE2B18
MLGFANSLSFRLLLLTVFFVMVAEVLIYTPSISRYRLSYLQEKLAEGHLAALSVKAAPDGMVTEMLARQLLDHVGAYSVVANDESNFMPMLRRTEVPEPDMAVDLRSAGVLALILDAFDTLGQPRNRVLRLHGLSPRDPDIFVTMLIDEAPMRMEMLDFSWRILTLSVVISLFTAALVFLSLRWLMVLPMQRITSSMTAFRQRPEDPTSDLPVSTRRDEIGIAVRELADMKQGVRRALRQNMRLATLGTAVNKINHDLRNMLATATLVSDRFAESSDPFVRKAVPPFLRTLDRAVKLCSDTLNFTQESVPLMTERMTLKRLLDDMIPELSSSLPEGQLAIEIDDVPGVSVSVDPDQIYRIFANLASNASRAGASRFHIRFEHDDGTLALLFEDNGPGIPDPIREKLFLPFQLSGNGGGSGLGLAIARDIARAHGGALFLVQTGATGSLFRLELPCPATGRSRGGTTRAA